VEPSFREDPRRVGQQGVESGIRSGHMPSERSFGLNLVLQVQGVKRLNISPSGTSSL
jgi:hypothetical protein